MNEDMIAFVISGLFYLIPVVILIVFIVQRVKAKKKETFEKRDN